MEPLVLGRVATTLALLLMALGLVTWRQSRAFEALSELETLRRQVSEAQAEQVELERTIQVLESRARVVRDARRRLSLHTPDASEQMILAGDPIS